MTYVPMIMADPELREDFQRSFGESYSELDASGEIADPTAEGTSPSARSVESSGYMEYAWIASVILLAYMLPFMMGFENAIGILIIGFALWQAFRMNARAKIELQGPFRLEARDTALG